MHERNKWNTLLLSLVITLTAVWVSGCQSGCSSSDIPITASSEKPSMNIKDTQLHGIHKKFIVDVEIDKDNQTTTLEGYKLQIAFIEQKNR